MPKHEVIGGLFASLFLLVSRCTPIPTATPTLEPTSPSFTCADLDTAWAKSDWPAVLNVLDQLEANDLICGHDSLNTKQYAAYVNYGAALENAGDVEAAVEQYRAALALDDRRQNALDALARLDALPDPTPPACNPDKLTPYTPSSSRPFIRIEEGQLAVGGQPFVVRGLNYYPRHAPWDRFLTEGNLEEMAKELDLISEAGFNTLRIFLWYEPLFTCAPEDAVPDAETFAKLDALIALAGERDLRLIVTLNDLPDLYFRPLYTDWAHYDAQAAFIASRYRDEPTILAWDLRNEGDLDYGARGGEGRFERDSVLSWLDHIAEIVQMSDDRHLITAGWWGDAAETAAVVDILSFHHWAGGEELTQRIRALKAQNDKPILVEEIGFSTWGEGGEAAQAKLLAEVTNAAEQNDTAGWLIWTAFDFGPLPGQAISPEHYFGVWRIDLTPKPVLNALVLK